MINFSRSKLRVRGGPFDGCGMSLVGGITTLGRESTNDIVMDQPTVSRNHARIFYNARGYWIQDLGSANGTFVNGLRIDQQPRALENGQRIQLGSVANGTVWEFIEAQEAGPSTESPPTLQISVATATATQAPTAPGQPGLQRATVAQAQESVSPCSAFQRNLNGSWTCRTFVAFDTSQSEIEVSRGTTFVLGNEFLGFDLAKWLNENCS